MSSKLKNAERLERKQQKADASLMSARYPDAASVIIHMNYYQRGTGQSIMQRTVNFFPSSAAYFHMECMRHDCIDGGFNLESVVTTMMRNRLESAKGDIVCPGNDSSGHARIDYKITIRYRNE